MKLINIKDPDVCVAFELLEGKHVAYEMTGNYSVDSAINYHLHESKYLENNTPQAVLTIYGMGGWNRYYVNTDGTIRFSRFHMGKNIIDDVKALGFIID